MGLALGTWTEPLHGRRAAAEKKRGMREKVLVLNRLAEVERIERVVATAVSAMALKVGGPSKASARLAGDLEQVAHTEDEMHSHPPSRFHKAGTVVQLRLRRAKSPS